MTLSRLAAACALLALSALPAAATDAKGCRDLAGLKRFDGSVIALCDQRKFAEYRLPVGKAVQYDYNRRQGTFEKQLDLEGRLTRNLYIVPAGPSSAEVFRNYRTELSAKGFTTLFEGRPGELGYWMAKAFENDGGPGGQILGYGEKEARYIAATKEEDGVTTHLAIYVLEYTDGYHSTLRPKKGQVALRIDMLQSGELKDQMVVVSAADIARSLDQAGRIALYGLNFDFNKATLQADSGPTLDEIAKFLKANPSQRVHVVGHTDSIGGVDSNQKLSQARAATVVSTLAKQYGIAANRLRPAGLGLLAPVATNATEEGRAKNRRVELLPQ